MNNRHTITGRLERVDRRTTSRYGNPTYALTVDGTEYLTQTNGAVGYEVTNYRIGRDVTLTLTHSDRVTAMTYANGERA